MNTNNDLNRFYTFLDAHGITNDYSQLFNNHNDQKLFLNSRDCSLWLRGFGEFREINEAWQMACRMEAEMLMIKEDAQADNVNHPAHYTSHPSGVEVIQITEHMGFCLGNAVKYIMRCDEKGAPIEDLKKAVWYLEREIAKREVLHAKVEELLMRPDL